MKYLFSALLLATCCSGFLSAQVDQKFIQPFLEQYCIECHTEEKSKGDIRFDHINANSADVWKLVFEQISSGDMPPEDKDQPDEKLKKNVMNYLLRHGEASKSQRVGGFRRLNKREYTNTVVDLLGLKKTFFDPGAFVYKDDVKHGFDTEANKLIISNDLLLEYLKSSEKSLRVALFADSLEKPEAKKVTVLNSEMKGKGGYIKLQKNENKLFDRKQKEGLGTAGYYKIKVTALGVDRDSHGGAKGPLILGIGVATGAAKDGSTERSDLHARYELLDEKPSSYEERVWIERGQRPYVNFINGMNKPDIVARTLARANKTKEYIQSKPLVPSIKVTEFSIDGPYYEEWPPEAYQLMGITSLDELNNAKARERILKFFIWRAFRRPIPKDEYEAFNTYLRKIHKETGDWHESLIRTFSAVMGSAEFLYIKEGPGELNDFELASRLSYLLWSTMPDKELLALANSGQMKKPEVLKAQIIRMMDSPRFKVFTRSFVDQWLSVDTLGSMRPSTEKNSNLSVYYKDNLETAMREETYLFFEHVLESNSSIREFIDSDYTFANRELAKLYDVPFKDGDTEYVKTALPKSSKRGGLLGHASILTLTSNGVETSPVERGHWVLDELLGTPPPAPPDNVAALVSDINGTTNLREQLTKHSEDPACMECHVKMDPPGFALEGFDPIGRVRKRYSQKQKVDSGGHYLGQDFADVDGFKLILMQQDKLVARNLIVKIAEYAKGRKLNLKDLSVVENILERSKKEAYNFKSMFYAVLTSELMTHK